MATKKTKNTRDLTPDHDFTFQEEVTGIIRFNDKNVLLISFDTAANKVTVTKLDDKTGDSLSGSVTLS